MSESITKALKRIYIICCKCCVQFDKCRLHYGSSWNKLLKRLVELIVVSVLYSKLGFRVGVRVKVSAYGLVEHTFRVSVVKC